MAQQLQLTQFFNKKQSTNEEESLQDESLLAEEEEAHIDTLVSSTFNTLRGNYVVAWNIINTNYVCVNLNMIMFKLCFMMDHFM